MRIRRLLAIGVAAWALPAVAAQTLAQQFPPYGLEPTSLTFTVSVCLADLEYTLGCREVGLLEAVKRLGQIYQDVYAMHRAAGSLRIWFPPHVPEEDQRRFLREVEDRAIAVMVKNMEKGADQSADTPTQSSGTYGESDLPLETAQAVRKWRDDASLEARNGTNWLHDWPSRTHLYRTGQTLRELAVLNLGNH